MSNFCLSIKTITKFGVFCREFEGTTVCLSLDSAVVDNGGVAQNLL